MQDFPPLVADLDPAHTPAAAEPAGVDRRPRRVFGDPDLRSPARFLGWLLRQQPTVLIFSALTSVLEWLPGAVGPYVIGQTVDHGLLARDVSVVGRGVLVMFCLSLVGLTAGVLNHTLVVRGWLIGMYGPMKMVTRKVVQLGHILTQRTPAGEVLSVSASDSDEFGGLTEVVGRFVGALVAFAVIVTLVLSTSVHLGLVVLVAAPLVVLLATPLLRPLQRREEVERTRSSELTSMATDIVAGLRILRGIGGEQTFARNYTAQSQRTRTAGVRAGIWQGLVDSTSVLASGLFLVVLTWLGAREVLADRLSVGELVSFFGYAVFMVWPIQTFFDLVQHWIRSLVSARKAIAVFKLAPPWRTPDVVLQLPVDAELHDQRSGFTARPGELTVVVSALPDDSAALADRLGRYLPVEQEPVSDEEISGLRGRAARRLRIQHEREREALAQRAGVLGGQAWGVRLGPVDLADVPLTEVRRRIVVSDSASQLFAGPLQTVLDPHGRLTREQAEALLHVAAAEDVFEAVQGGWQGVVDERGRGLSGGQRQRIVLARVLGLDPDILVMVEPTSAVDAHTEALIADRLSDHRRGRTTVITTVSPLLLHHADRIAFLDGGRVVAYGTHEELLRTHDGYRSVVIRGDEDHD